MSQWKGKLAGLVAAGLLAVLPLSAVPALAEPPAVPEDIYQWVQSTARQNYYFNKQQMCYEIRADGTVDEHVLIVPTLRTYDDVQIQDVISKRRWKLEDLTGYDALAGAAEYLRIDLAAQTVTITEHDDLDGDWGVIREEKEPEIVQLAELSEKDVDACFYRAIIKYAQKHAAELRARTEQKAAEAASEEKGKG